jgi:hypothetical protein
MTCLVGLDGDYLQIARQGRGVASIVLRVPCRPLAAALSPQIEIGPIAPQCFPASRKNKGRRPKRVLQAICTMEATLRSDHQVVVRSLLNRFHVELLTNWL